MFLSHEGQWVQCSGWEQGLWGQTAWVWIPTLPLTPWVTWASCLAPLYCFLICEIGVMIVTSSHGCYEDWVLVRVDSESSSWHQVGAMSVFAVITMMMMMMIMMFQKCLCTSLDWSSHWFNHPAYWTDSLTRHYRKALCLTLRFRRLRFRSYLRGILCPWKAVCFWTASIVEVERVRPMCQEGRE